MRIAFLVDQFPVLSETPYLNQITGMVKRGHDVEVFADYPPRHPAYHADIDRLGLLARTRYTPVIPVGAAGRLRGALRLTHGHSGLAREVLRRAMNPLVVGLHAGSLRLPFHAVPFLPGRSYDIVHCCFGPDGIRGDRLRRIGAVRGRLVTSFRGADVTRYVKSRGERVYRGLLRRGDLFMPVSHDFARRIERMGADPRRIVVHRTGIDVRLFAYRSRAVRAGVSLQLVTVARLVEKKGIEYVVRAVARLVAEGAEVRFTIVGDGALREPLARLAGDLGVGDRVHFAGWRPQHEVRDIMDAADVLVAASVTAASGDQEGIPNAVKEGMALGLPVLSTLHSGIPELVDDGVSGFLVPERDEGALAARIRTLYDAPALRESMGRAGRARVEREYDIERLNDALEAQYRRLLDRPAGDSPSGERSADVG